MKNFSELKTAIVSAILVSYKDQKISVSSNVSVEDSTAFTALSDDEKKLISGAVSKAVKQRIGTAMEKEYTGKPLHAVNNRVTPYIIPAPLGSGKVTKYTLLARQFLSAESAQEYDTIALALNKLFSYNPGQSTATKAKIRTDIKFYLDKAFKLIAGDTCNIRANEKDVDLLLQSSIQSRADIWTTAKESKVQEIIEHVLHDKIANTPYFVEILSKDKNFSGTIQTAVDFAVKPERKTKKAVKADK